MTSSRRPDRLLGPLARGIEPEPAQQLQAMERVGVVSCRTRCRTRSHRAFGARAGGRPSPRSRPSPAQRSRRPVAHRLRSRVTCQRWRDPHRAAESTIAAAGSDRHRASARTSRPFFVAEDDGAVVSRGVARRLACHDAPISGSRIDGRRLDLNPAAGCRRRGAASRRAGRRPPGSSGRSCRTRGRCPDLLGVLPTCGTAPGQERFGSG